MFILSEDYWELKLTKDRNRGIFAKKIIPPGTVIGDYLGLLLPASQENKIGPTYTMYFNDTSILVPSDPSEVDVHLLNHSCISTCDTYPYKGHALIFALRKIFPGEELTFQYLIDPPVSGNEPTSMHPCLCGSLICHGTMNTTPQIVEKLEETLSFLDDKDYEKLPVPYGNELPKLDFYPKKIPDHSAYDLCGSFIKTPFISHEKRLPSINNIRNKIRMTGRRINYINLGFTLVGIMDGVLISQKNED